MAHDLACFLRIIAMIIAKFAFINNVNHNIIAKCVLIIVWIVIFIVMIMVIVMGRGTFIHGNKARNKRLHLIEQTWVGEYFNWRKSLWQYTHATKPTLYRLTCLWTLCERRTTPRGVKVHFEPKPGAASNAMVCER